MFLVIFLSVIGGRLIRKMMQKNQTIAAAEEICFFLIIHCLSLSYLYPPLEVYCLSIFPKEIEEIENKLADTKEKANKERKEESLRKDSISLFVSVFLRDSLFPNEGAGRKLTHSYNISHLPAPFIKCLRAAIPFSFFFVIIISFHLLLLLPR